MSLLVSQEIANASGALDGRPAEKSTPHGDETLRLKEIFSDLAEFEVGELSRLCISKDFFSVKSSPTSSDLTSGSRSE